jgi:hypothetical protein
MLDLPAVGLRFPALLVSAPINPWTFDAHFPAPKLVWIGLEQVTQTELHESPVSNIMVVILVFADKNGRIHLVAHALEKPFAASIGHLAK